MSIEKVHSHIDSMTAKDQELLADFVRQPSISAQNIGVRECAEMLKKYLDSLGFATQIIESPGLPFVYGELKSKNPDAKTMIFYGHYDVQPPEPLEPWNTPPFEPTIIDGKMYGRGTADNKGQFLAHMLAIRSYLETTGDVPVNCKFVLEGEEESGSPQMEWFVRNHLDMLEADGVYFSDGPVHASGAPEIKHGFRGMYSCEISIVTAKHANHSGRTGGLIPNAAIELARLVGTMIDENNHITIDGFYDDVLDPSDYEQTLIDAIPFAPEESARMFGATDIIMDKQKYLMQQMFRPTFTVNGMLSGYVGKGRKTSVPHASTLKFDMRLVANQDPDDIEEKVRKHVEKHCKFATISSFTKQYPSKTPPELPFCKAIVEATRKWFPTAVAVPTSSGTCGDFVWTKILKIPSVTVPYGNPDQQNHAANENFSMEYFNKGIHNSAQVIDAVSKI